MDRRQPGSFRSTRRRGFSTWIAIVVVAVPVAAAVAWRFLSGGNQAGETLDVITCAVERGDFVHVITERGNIESAENEEIRCEVQSLNTAGTRILKIVPEGTKIVPGGPYLRPADGKAAEPLVEFDSSSLVNDQMKQESTYNASLAALIQAQSVLDTAFIAWEEYFGESPVDRNPKPYIEALVGISSMSLGAVCRAPCVRFHIFSSAEGKYFLDENAILSELDVSQENLRRSRDTERYSEQLEAKGYITKVQLEADRFARQKAEKDLDAARKKLEVLQNYTRRKMEVQLKADIDTAKAKCDAAQATFNLDKSKLQLINEQIVKCTIRAKKPGQVVYANVTERMGGSEIIIEEGALVRERQVIVRLPNPDKMQVKAKVNEAKIAMVSAGMPARIRLDAFPEVELEGRVESVSEYPAPGMWWASNVKEYDTIVTIDKSSVDLRPGYTADVTILIKQQFNVLKLPVQAVIEQGGEQYCAVRTPSGFEARRIKVGANNDEFVVIREGLTEEDVVVQSAAKVRDKIGLPDAPPETMARTMLTAAQGEPAAKGLPSQKAATMPLVATLQQGGENGKKTDRPPENASPAELADWLFRQLDKDRGGKIKEQDLPAEYRGMFAKADTNGDKILDRAEFNVIAVAMIRQLNVGSAKRPPKPPSGSPGGAAGGGL